MLLPIDDTESYNYYAREIRGQSLHPTIFEDVEYSSVIISPHTPNEELRSVETRGDPGPTIRGVVNKKVRPK